MTDPEDITAWQRLGPEITTSGALSEGDIARLAEIGTRHVINLSTSDNPDYLNGEADLLKREGIAYSDIPIPFAMPEEKHYQRFVEAFEHGEKPVHVHCIMNWRVSAFFYRYHREHGMSEEEARALMAQQWEPDRKNYPTAERWGDFVAAVDQSA